MLPALLGQKSKRELTCRFDRWHAPHLTTYCGGRVDELNMVAVWLNRNRKRKRLTTCLFVSLNLKPTLTETTVVSQFLGHYTMKYTRSGYAAKIQKIINHTVSKQPEEKLTIISKTHKTSQVKKSECLMFDNSLFVNKFRVAVENATVKLNISESGIFIFYRPKHVV